MKEMSTDVGCGIPWRQIALSAGIGLAGAGAAYLLYKSFQKEDFGAQTRTDGSGARWTNPNESERQAPFAANHQSSTPSREPTAKALADEATRIKNEGNELFKQEKYQEAIEKYTEALRILPEANVASAATFYQNRAAAHEKLENGERVVADCSSAIEKNRNYTKAYLRRAKAFEEMRKYKEALDDFTAGCVLEQFSNQRSLESADRVLKSHSELRAKAEIENRSPDFIVPLSKTFVQSYFSSFCEDPVLNTAHTPHSLMNGHISDDGSGDNNATAYDEMLLCMGDKRYEEAVERASEVIKGRGYRLPEALLIRATFGLIRGRSELATQDFDEFFKEVELIEDEDRKKKLKANALVKRGSFMMQQGKKEECFKDFEEAEKVDPENADVFHHRGQLEILINEMDKAKADFDKCNKLRPQFAVARVQGCFADYRQAVSSNSFMDTNNAIQKFERLMRDEFPDCSEGHALLGQVYSERGAFADAEQSFDRALELSPDNANIWVHKGLLELQKNENYARALELMKKALDVDPNSEFAFETIATLEVQQGNTQNAMACFDSAIDLARTELELVHLFSIREAAIAQQTVFQMLGIELPSV